MISLNTRTSLISLALLSAGLLGACGDAAPVTPDPVPSEPAPKVESDPVTVPVEPATTEPAAAAPVENVPAAKDTLKPEAPADDSTEVDSRLALVRDAAASLGIDLSDADLSKVASYVKGKATKENIAAALKQFGADDPDSAIGSLAGKLGVDIPGSKNSDGASKDAADAVAGAKKTASDALGGALGGVIPGAKKAAGDATGGAAKGGAMTVQALRAERKAALAQLEAGKQKELSDIRATLAERSKKNPARAEIHAGKLVLKEKAIEADYAAKVTQLKADYKARIQAAKGE